MMRRNKLEEDMEMDILLRLPVKSLLRFRCVSKSWCARFQSQLFITNHCLKQTNKINNNDYANVSVILPRLERGCYPEPHLWSFSLLDQTLRFKEKIFPLPKRKRSASDSMETFMSACNGLICWLIREHITLWNPATREFKHLPKSHNRCPPKSYPSTMGFGFDSKTNDYKVICIYTNTFDWVNTRQVYLYTLSTDSWREVEIAPDFPLLNTPEFGTYVNGVYHWEARLETCIFSFDMGDEVFSRLPLPSNFSFDKHFWNLGVLNGYLAVIHYPSYPDVGMEGNFDIWVMKEYGVKESWTKQLAIGPIPTDYFPVGFWKNGGLFFIIINDHKPFQYEAPAPEKQLVLYDPKTQEIEKLQFHFSVLISKVVIYVESLVPINGRREHEDEHFIRLSTQIGDA